VSAAGAPPVFHDPSGKRRRVFRRALALVALVLAGLSSVFFASLLAVPLLPSVPALSGLKHSVRPPELAVQSRDSRLGKYLLRKTRERLWREIERTEARLEHHHPATPASAPAAAGRPIRGAFYGTWQETGLVALRTHADQLTHLFPEWLRLDPSGSSFDTHDFDLQATPHNKDVIAVARSHQLEIHPLLSNGEGGVFQKERAHRLLSSPDTQRALAVKLRRWLVEQRFSGLNLDLEDLSSEDYAKLPGFCAILAAELHPAGMALSIDLEAGATGAPLEALAKNTDFIVLMGYDEHFAGGEPGPIAPLPWFSRALEATLARVPRDKLVVGIGNYAYDWPLPEEGGPRTAAESLTYEQALVRARTYRTEEDPKDVVALEPESLNAHFDYQDEDGARHEVWMLDAVSAYDQWHVASRFGLRGGALWVLGSEDPGLWSFFDKSAAPAKRAPVADLATVSSPFEIEYDGKGEILSLRSTPVAGRRTLAEDDTTGLLTEESYQAFPATNVIARSGWRSGAVAITFDDGPDPRWTPKVLEVLRRHDVHATFFVIGESAERYPDLIRQIWREGHEIGNHTFTHPNLAAVGRQRAELELNATQRALESILGRSTLLFRPPYNADAEPQSAEEISPILLATTLGYVSVGMRVDPQDWKLDARSAEELAGQARTALDGAEGNVVLFHDGGGDRSRTVAALDLLLSALSTEHRQTMTVSALMGRSRDQLMPPVERREAMLVGIDRFVFEALYLGETFLSVAFFAAILLGIGRVLFTVPLALVGVVREKRRIAALPPVELPVSVLIAAYNEQPVIARTIDSILAGSHPILEIVVIDDGSSDGTSEEVARRFGDQPRVRLVRQANAGKAAALNHGISLVKGEILVCLDADTQLAPDAVGLMARNFADPKVGAVAGNVKVGNRDNVFTRWQAIEYITSQNLDRRAYAVLNAMTVVPGAVGAWRKNAVVEAGGYVTDTLAEDMDLTFRLRRAGWTLLADTGAVGYTEAPDTLAAFSKQRFRWAYGTLQCLSKHKSALFSHGWFGWFALPMMWTFQVAFQLLAPVVDLQLYYTIGRFLFLWITQGVLRQDWQPLPNATQLLVQTGFFYALFFAVELGGAAIAFRLDRERLRLLWWLFWQRFVYRQLMYAVVWKSILRAIHGMREGWGKLERKGTVELPKG
jgi:cellulose synthase/poly-beta-1,6-N-acetylglucosamine synthase-like glycosyltransferase/peptidoglycan/xylan/chitin deacetylase (PgdA/CDA1 family)/spore germination protein YaaH